MGFKVTLGNLRSGRAIQVQYVPTELKETFGAAYAKLAVPGLSHEILQFSNGQNFSFQASFAMSGLVDAEVPLMEQRKFLMSLVTPSRGAGGVKQGDPPNVLVDWPELYLLSCKLVKCDGVMSLFADTGKPTQYIAACSFEECRLERLYSEDVVRNGTLRGP